MSPARTLELDTLTLASGGHPPGGEMCVMEAVAFVAGEKWSDHPKCASPVLGAFLRRLNDRLNTADRQRLKPLILKLVGTNTGPADETTRALMAADWVYRVGVPRWMDAAGLTEQAAVLRALPMVTTLEQLTGMVPVMAKARDAARAKRSGWWDKLREQVRAAVAEKLKDKPKAAAVAVAAAVAAAAADAVADAVAAAVAAAAADAAADAVAVAAAVAVAVAAAVAAAAADADAVAVAAAVAAAAADAVAAAVAAADAAAAAAADAVADAAADAAAVAVADPSRYWKIRNAVYQAVYDKIRAQVGAQVGALVEKQNGESLDDAIALAERMAAVGR